MANKEKLKFRIEFYSQFWDKSPIAEIRINDSTVYKDQITGSEDKPTLAEFDYELTEGEKYELTIIRSNKDRRQTVVEDGKIVKDQLLNIKSIEIDEIDIGALVYEGEYTPEYPEPWATQQREAGNELPKSFKNVTILGHNGTWKLPFTSPFYMWLLENLY
jgi:hypothetical protein